MDTNPILKTFQNWLQVNELEFNSLGFCSLPLPSGMVLRVVDLNEEGHSLLFLEITQIPPPIVDMVSGLVDLTNAHPGLTGGFDLSVSENPALLFAQIRLDNLATEEQVKQTTGELVALGERWRELVSQLSAAGTPEKIPDRFDVNVTNLFA